ncbi:MAG: DUF4276 family protein [Capsulimonadaceae bacterium]|nr:DUF4276 family protein [Capsulimonadaceae bacterium]
MTHIKLYVEGGGTTRKDQGPCREGFSKFIEKLGIDPRSFKVIACGGRANTFKDFVTAFKQSEDAFVALLVDSEDPVADIEQPWTHLRERPGDGWIAPPGATDNNALLMVTCMETWLTADQDAIRRICGSTIKAHHLPTEDLETRDRHVLKDKLAAATKDCKKTYAKGDVSFAILAEVAPDKLANLPSFNRMRRILQANL